MKKSVFIEADVGRVGGEADVFLAVGFDEAARGKALESGGELSPEAVDGLIDAVGSQDALVYEAAACRGIALVDGAVPAFEKLHGEAEK